MALLENFPYVNQLDGSNNAEYNCVPASICAAMSYLTHKTYAPDVLKNLVYGSGYANAGTAASAFVDYVAQQGVNLHAVENADTTSAIARAHTELAAGHPVIFTQQDDYSPNPDFTHVCVFFADSSGELTAMDPFGAKSLVYNDATWAGRLRSSELWILELENVDLSLSNATVAHNFAEVSSTSWRCKRNNVLLHDGHLKFYRQHDGLALFGLPLTNEIALKEYPGTAIVVYERVVACYDPARKIDRPPISGDIYLMHLDSGVAQQLVAQSLTKALQAQIATLSAQITTLQHEQAPALKAALKQIYMLVQPLQ